MTDIVKAWVQTSDEAYCVWAPADLADQIGDNNDEGWVSLALVKSDEYICLRAVHIIWFRRMMTAAEMEGRQALAMAEKRSS